MGGYSLYEGQDSFSTHAKSGQAVDYVSSGEEHVENMFFTGPNGLGLHFGLSSTWTWIGLCSTLG